MITLPMPDLSDDDFAERWYNDSTKGMCGLRNADDALDDVDKLLGVFGLQIGMYETGSTDYLFRIVPLPNVSGELSKTEQTEANLLEECRSALAEQTTKVKTFRDMIRGAEAHYNKVLNATTETDYVERAIVGARLAAITDLAKALQNV